MSESVHTYDLLGRQLAVTNPRGKTTTYAFNSAGYTTNITNHLGQQTTITRDPTSNVVTQVLDHLQRKTVLGYDVNKNVSSITRYKDPIATPPPTRNP
jgi:YD repeat-containing protein